MEYFKFQTDGIDWLTNHFRCLLADEMGLGKTVQIIGLVNKCPGVERVLVVCPASLKLNWAAEIEKWDSRGMDIQVLSGSPTTNPLRPGYTIINYDILSKWGNILLDYPWDLAAFDEAHYLKNIKAKRTKVALSLNANRMVFMTGTPMVNRPVEMFNMLNKIGLFGNRRHYEIKYCNAKQVRKFGRIIWDNSGASNLDDLRQKIQPIMLRRLKKDVLTELPDKIHQVIELSGCEDILDGVEWYDELPVGGSATAEARHEAGLAKVPAAIEHIKSVLEQKDKVIIFAHHRAVVEQLREGLKDYGAATITGGTPPNARQEHVKFFQTRDDVRVIICNIQAAGVGLTLTAADTVIFVELDWVPGNMKQAEDRAHRIGQKNNVLVQYLVAPGVDAQIGRALAKKIKNMEAIGC